MTGAGRIDSKSEGERLLLVEGINDCHAVFHLFSLVHGIAPTFGLHECGGDDEVLDSLSARLVSSNPKQKALGLVLDSDIEGTSPAQVIQSRLDQLRARAGKYYDIPAEIPEQGLIVDPIPDIPESNRVPKLGLWLMPNNKAYGMFEDLLLDSLDEKVREYTSAVVYQARTDKIARFKEAHTSKAVIRTYMSWQDPPDMQHLGPAIKKGTFADIEAVCKTFVQWLEALFGAPPQA